MAKKKRRNTRRHRHAHAVAEAEACCGNFVVIITLQGHRVKTVRAAKGRGEASFGKMELKRWPQPAASAVSHKVIWLPLLRNVPVAVASTDAATATASAAAAVVVVAVFRF